MDFGLGKWRKELGARLVDGFFEGTSRAGRLLPLANPKLHNLEVIRDVRYAPTDHADHLLDIYRPLEMTGKPPVVLYLHGGGFRILSKESHWVFGLLFARRGYVVANASYRLAPAHTYPAAHQDAFEAYAWTVRNIDRFGGDPTNIIVAGESAGANLATSLALATSYRRPEPWAQAVYELGVQPKAVVAACGFLQVSDPGRFSRGRRLNRFLQDRFDEVCEAYLPSGSAPGACELADPLCILESGVRPDRPLPPFFAFCGTWDLLTDDTARLTTALEALGSAVESRYYERGLHGFHAFVFDPNARRCWRDIFRFLGRTLPRVPTPATRLFSGE
jgi:acetyl esterase